MASVRATLLVGPPTVVGVTGATVLATAWVTAVVVCTGGVMTGVVTAVVATPPATVVATPPATVVAARGGGDHRAGAGDDVERVEHRLQRDGILGLHLQDRGERLIGRAGDHHVPRACSPLPQLVPTWISPVNTPSE